MNTFSLKVIACDRVFFDGRCEQVVLPLHDGEKAIQAHHENMVFAVEIGEIRITDETGEEIVGVTGTGFAQIINNRAMVIVDTCESPEEIDVRNRAFRSIIVPKHRWRARCRASRSGKKTVRPDIKKENGLVQGPGGSEREKTSLQTRGSFVFRKLGMKKGCSRVWEGKTSL